MNTIVTLHETFKPLLISTWSTATTIGHSPSMEFCDSMQFCSYNPQADTSLAHTMLTQLIVECPHEPAAPSAPQSLITSLTNNSSAAHVTGYQCVKLTLPNNCTAAHLLP